MVELNRNQSVLVTGANGYVASWIVKRLLDEGLTVHAAVRDPDQHGKVGHLSVLAAKSSGKLRLFRADLLTPGAYLEAMAGCTVVFHTASPFTLSFKDPQKELIDPALEGTRNVLDAVNATPSVQRVVLTSSCAAIYGDNIDVTRAPGGTLTEEVWNTTSTLDNQPYSYSKTLAEQEAWRMARAQARWKLVTINPSLVIGPGVNPGASSESFKVVRQIGNGKLFPAAPDLGIGVVDVREVAEAHFRAAFLPQAQGRYIVSAHDTNLLGMAWALLPRFQKYPLPRMILPKWIAWLVVPLVDRTISRKFIQLNAGFPFHADHGRSVRELQLNYRPLEESMQEMFAQLIDSGQIKRR